MTVGEWVGLYSIVPIICNIADYYELHESPYVTNPPSSDTDNDGVTDSVDPAPLDGTQTATEQSATYRYNHLGQRAPADSKRLYMTLIVVLIFFAIGSVVGLCVESPNKYVPLSGYISLFILVFFVAVYRGGGIYDWESFKNFFMSDPSPKRIMALPLFCFFEGFSVVVVSRWILNKK